MPSSTADPCGWKAANRRTTVHSNMVCSKLERLRIALFAGGDGMVAYAKHQQRAQAHVLPKAYHGAARALKAHIVQAQRTWSN